MFQPHLEALPPAQRALWPELAQLPKHFVLYGGTALALRLGHRESVDFDFFTHELFEPAELLNQIGFLKQATILQNAAQTLTVATQRNAPLKVSFFGGLTLGRVGNPDPAPDGAPLVASLLDLAGTKAAVVTQRAESKDYLDLLALVHSGIRLEKAMGAGQALYGERYNPLLTLKALTYFGDGDLHRLTHQQRAELLRLATDCPTELPTVPRVSSKLC